MDTTPTTTPACDVCGAPLTSSGGVSGQCCLACLIESALEPDSDARQPGQAADETSHPSGAANTAPTRFAHYEISGAAGTPPVELGRGAMGVTFRATDTSLHCPVALKVINVDLAAHPRARARFRREAQAAANLRHPHVASVFFFGERPEDGRPFYAMELVEGETLQARVRRTGGLPVTMALDIIAQVADALRVAEAQGLTHRDLKPANLMLVAGDGVNVKVIDFGLAKAAAADGAEDSCLTGGADFVGTPAFASPEQFDGWQGIDTRSDFYALGATLWYALTGYPPFAGRTLAEIHNRQMHGSLPLEQLRAARVPKPVVDLLRSLLSPDPAGRPQTAHDLAAALDRCKKAVATSPASIPWRAAALAAVVLGLLTMAAAVPWWRQRTGQPTAVAPVADKSIAVLPFDNLSAGKDEAFFADGVQGEILTDLARVAELKVISRASVMQYRGDAPRNLQKIMDELGVAHVLEGSVQRAGGKVRVNAQLIDARTGAQLWAEKYDRDLSDVFAIQSDISQAIADQLRARLSTREKAAVQERPTSDLAAYDLYLRARELVDLSDSDTEGPRMLREMIRLLDEAVARDPKFLQAYCLLARAHEDMYWYGYDPTPAQYGLADEALAAGARLQPDTGEVHLGRGIHLYHRRNYAGALGELEVAGRLLPNDADVFLFRGSILRREGRWDDSVREYLKGIALNPRGQLALEQLYTSYLALRRYDEARRTIDRLLTIAPDRAYLRGEQSMIDLYSRGDPKAAHAVVPGLVEESPASAEDVAGSAMEFALCTRDTAFAKRALAASPQTGFPSRMLGFAIPRDYVEGTIARLSADPAEAQADLTRASNELAHKVAEAPDEPERLGLLGLVDAALGRKVEATAEGQRCVQLMREARDEFKWPYGSTLLAAIYANSNEKGKALDRLSEVISVPGGPSYGFLCLHPIWDPLRSEPRFQALLEAARKPVDLSKFHPADFPPPLEGTGQQ